MVSIQRKYMLDLEQRTPEWYAARLGIVTASAVGKLLTPTLQVAANDTSRGLIASLVAEQIAGVVEESPMTSDMWRGVEMEPYARERYAEVHDTEVVECGFIVAGEEDWTLGYSPDGLVGDDGLIEIKCPRAKGHVQTILADAVPAHYMAQCQAGLLASGREWIDYVSFHAGLPLFVKRVTPDPKWHDAIIAACRAFEDSAGLLQAGYFFAARDLPPTKRIELEMTL